MPTEQIEKLTFKKLIMTIGNLPSSYVESLSYYECMLWLCNYLENTVVPTVNNNGEAVEELQALFVQLKTFVDEYFENLDVQEEVNTKLDEMAEDGTITNLIKDYVDPIYEEYETTLNGEFDDFKDDVNEEIDTFENGVNTQMTQLSSLVSSSTSGAPLVASSTAGMTDTTRVYVNTTDGKWYYYNGTTWVAGGVYQSAGLNADVFGLDPDTVDGFLENNGNINPQTTNGEKTTDYIDVIPGGNVNIQLQFSTTKDIWLAVGYYKNTTYLRRDVLVATVPGTSTNKTVTIPSDCNRIRFSFRTYSEANCYTITDLTNYNFIYNKLNTQNDRLSIISPGEFMTYNSITQVLTIKAQTMIMTPNQYPQWYSVPNATTVDLSSLDSSAVNVLYNKNTHEFSAKRYYDPIDYENEYIFATVRKQGSGIKQLVSITTSCPYTIDNEPINYPSKYPTAIVGGAGYVTLDTTFETLTIPADTIIINKAANTNTLNDFYVVTEAQTLDLSSTGVSSSAIKVYFDTISHEFVAIPYHEYFENRYILFCAIRRSFNGRPWEISGNFPYYIDGNKYDVVDLDNKNIKMIAHRGYSTLAPENTLPSYKLARKMGFRYVECDVSFTSDSVPVLLHDDTIDRTSNGTGNINELTYEQVRQYDFGSWKNAKFTGTKIPSFEEFIRLCKNLGLHPYIEMKGSYDSTKIASLYNIVKSFGMLKNVTWISFSTNYLSIIKTLDSSARLGVVVNEISSSTITTAQGLKTDDNEVFIDTGNNTSIGSAMTANIPVERWTINSASDVTGMNYYVTGITTNSLNVHKILYDSNI